MFDGSQNEVLFHQVKRKEPGEDFSSQEGGKIGGLEQDGLRKQDVVFQVHVFVEIVFEFPELLVRETIGVAGIVGESIVLGKTTDGMDGIPHLLVFPAEQAECLPEVSTSAASGSCPAFRAE